MDLDQTLQQLRSMIGAERVYGTPIERDGVTVVPAAKVAGGGGGGTDEEAHGSGGAGFGVNARPAGALIVGPTGEVTWKGFFDLNRVVVGFQLVAVCGLLFAWLGKRSTARAEMKAVIATAAIDRAGRLVGRGDAN